MIRNQNNAAQHVLVGKTLLAQMDADNQEMIRTPRGLWVSVGWQKWNRLCKIDLEFRIELVCRELGIPSSTALIYETRKWIERQPELWRNELSGQELPF